MIPQTPAPAPANKARVIIGIMLALVIGGGVASFVMSDSKPRKPATKRQEIISITLPPPPPPPPVTPPPPKNEPPPPKEEEMIAQEPVPDDEPPPDDSPPESPPSEDLSTGIVGNGPGMGLTGGGGNGTIGGTGRRGGGSKFGWYAAKVQSTITVALRRHPSTRSATMSLQVRIWPDANGRITRAQLVGTSGNAAVDEAIRSNILTGLMLPQPPPADMPTPIVLRINARKPS